MSLYFPADEVNILTDQPRLHALIIGVDEYDHLGLGVPKPSRLLSGLSPLTIATPSARRVATWLESNYTNPDCPLGSVELLLAPQQTIVKDDGTNVTVDKSTMANIKTSANAWFKRCDTNANNIAFFYFAGHGISTISRFLLPADFGDPELADDWENCIDASGLQDGMTKCKAQHQYFFLDACRDAPLGALTQKNPRGHPLVGGADFEDTVALSAVYSAASEGRQAFGRDGEGTFFSEALLMCLNGIAANRPSPRKWQVDAASLGNALVSIMQSLAERENKPLSCECRVQRPEALHYPPIGQVLVKIDCDTKQRQDESNIQLTQGAHVFNSPSGDPRPWLQSVEAGDVNIQVTYTSFPAETIDDRLMPPVYRVDLPL